MESVRVEEIVDVINWLVRLLPSWMCLLLGHRVLFALALAAVFGRMGSFE